MDLRNKTQFFLYTPMKVKVKSLSGVQSLRPRGLWPTRLLRPWHSPGKNSGVGYHFLLHIHLYEPIIQLFPTHSIANTLIQNTVILNDYDSLLMNAFAYPWTSRVYFLQKATGISLKYIK